MSLVQLRSVVEVHRHRSISRAADELGLTQPAVSQHIASLEAQIERPLFIRLPRGVKPTAIADDLVRRIAAGLDEAEAAFAELRARSTGLSGRLHLCGPADILADLVTPHLHVLIEHRLSLQLHPVEGELINAMLLDGRADFAFGVDAVDDPRIASVRVGTQELLLVASPEMAGRIAQAGGPGYGLPAHPLITYEPGRYLIRQWTGRNGIGIGQAGETVIVPDLRCLCNLVTLGFGWSVLPRYAVAKALAEGGLVAIDGPNGNPLTHFHMRWLKAALRSPRIARARSLILDRLQSGG